MYPQLARPLRPMCPPGTTTSALSHPKQPPKDPSSPPSPAPGPLYIYSWSVFPDMAVLDWYIRLQDKDRLVWYGLYPAYYLTMCRMAGCDLSYGAEAGGNTTSVQNFLPLYRTIKIQPLTANTSYWVHMVCKDKDGGWHASDTVNFTTGNIHQLSTAK